MADSEAPSSGAGGALEQLLLRVVPGLATAWKGAAPADIDRLETLAGRPLPALYRWFLEHLGSSMGPMSYPTLDFSAAGILSRYAAGHIERHPRYLLIAYDDDDVTPAHYFYDLDRPARQDALVLRMLTPRDEPHDQLEQFETLREMLAWGELWAQRVEHAPQRLRGSLRAPSADLHHRLSPALRALGFDTPVETGGFCGLYERADAVLVCSSAPDAERGEQSFNLGGSDAGQLARISSAIADAGVEVTPTVWLPPLPTSAE
jgi:hypothetical protein